MPFELLGGLVTPYALFLAHLPALVMVAGDIATALGAGLECGLKKKCGNDKRSILPEPVKMRFEKRQTGLCGVPQYNFDQCNDQLQGITVTISSPSAGR